ncbi:MAG: PAS domain S-box protein [Desulfurivibrionaceae bacterium]
MKIDRKGLAFRLTSALLLTFIFVAAFVFPLGSRIIGNIVDDYQHLIAKSHSSETRRLFEAAVAELTTARLLGNPEVAAAQRLTLLETISLNWRQRGVGGVIAGPDGAVLLSTFSPQLTSRIIVEMNHGFVEINDHDQELFGLTEQVHPWNWRVLTAISDHGEEVAKRTVLLLIPLLIMGPLSALLVLFFVFRRQVQRPVAMLLAGIGRGEAATESGVTEFDRIGEAINRSLNGIRERSASLAEELAERKRAEEMVRRQETQIRLLLNSTAEGIYGVDTLGICTFCNPSCCRMLGFSEEALLGRNIHELIHHSYADGRPYPEVDCHVSRTCQTGHEAHEDQEVFWRADGSSLAVEYWSYPIRGKESVLGAVVAFFDISQRKQAEEELRVAWKNWETTFNATADLIVLLDPDGAIRQCNQAFASFCGIDAQELIGRRQQPLLEIPDAPFLQSRESKARKEAEVRVAGKTYGIVVDPIIDEEGCFAGAVQIMHDISERKRAEAQLIHAQKMEGIGHLAGGVAHDFNNILSVIQGYADLLRMIRAEDQVLVDHLEQIRQAVQRGTTITRQILAFSRKDAISLKNVDLNQLVIALEKLLRRLVREDIDIQLRPSSAPLVIAVDAGQIDQVLINLATNACHAMPDGGTFRIETKIDIIDDDFIRAHGYGRVGSYAKLIVSDTGIGMSEEVQSRIFDPFFTTKEVGAGTGLGLAMVYGIIGKHHGFINVYSEPGHGTVFRIYLPLAVGSEPGRGELAKGTDAGDFQGGSETILFAEDDPALRSWLKSWLGMNGYTVIEAADGEEAVRKFSEQSDNIQLVMLDGIMPRMNGKEALLTMRQQRPDLRAILLSGYAEDIFSRSELVDLRVSYLEKPVDPARLMRQIRQVLDGV